VDAAEGDRVGARGGRLTREAERIADVVGDVLDLRHLVVVREDHRVARLGEGADLALERGDVLQEQRCV
jgi:hypothetical protein